MADFMEEYGKYARENNLNSDPFHPLHFYDYKAYWNEYGKFPEKGEHGDSKFKILGHPNLIVFDDGQWIDTRTGEKATQELVERNMQANKRVSKEHNEVVGSDASVLPQRFRDMQ